MKKKSAKRAKRVPQKRARRIPQKRGTSKTAMRMYAGARFDRLTADWIASWTSADTEIRGSLIALRGRSRQLDRDNDYARSVFRDLVVNTVGTGVNFQSHIFQQRGDKLNDVLNEQVETAWNRWTRKEYCDVAGRLCFSDMERMLMRSVIVSGEIFVRKVQQSFGGSKIPYGLEIIEADLVDDFYNGVEPNGNVVRMGIEVDSWGRPVAYHILKKHPGDYQFDSNKDQLRGRDRVRIPASEIIHLYISERPGQTRGVPWLASTMTRLRHMAGYEEGEVIAARVGASLMGFIETPEGELQGDAVSGEQRLTDFEPGVFKQLNPGEKMNVPNISRPGGQFDPFMKVMLRGVAASAGTSYENVSTDYSTSNFSSARQALISVRDNYRILQWWLIYNFHQAVFEGWLDMAVLSNQLKLPKFDTDPEVYYASANWRPRGWQWIDPQKEVLANRDAVAAGFKTQAEVVAEMGGDFEELITQRKAEIAKIKAAGLIFESEAGLVKPPPQSGVAGADTTGQGTNT